MACSTGNPVFCHSSIIAITFTNSIFIFILFKLKKYFDSMLLVKERPEFKDFAKEFMICTNNNFDEVNLKKNGISLEDAKESLEIFGNLGRKCKLVMDLNAKGLF